MPRRFFPHFISLSRLLGFRATVVFSVSYLLARLAPERAGRLHRVRVGRYRFYFPSLTFFNGLFTEIFLHAAYQIEATDAPLSVIDCGANIGVSLLYIKLRAPHARVLCFEPNPAARAVLEKNIAANYWDDVTVLPYALGPEGTAEFFIEHGLPTSSSASLAPFRERSGRPLDSFPVQIKPLSLFITQPIDFLKMDIEGAEWPVLEDLRDTHRLGLIRTIQLEYHYHPTFFPRPLADIEQLLREAGFRVSSSPTAGNADNKSAMVHAWRE